MSGEGYFDVYTFLQCFKKKAQSQGVQYINAEVCGVSCHDNKVTGVEVGFTQIIEWLKILPIYYSVNCKQWRGFEFNFGWQ